MSVRFYFAFIAVCVWTIGANGHSPNNGFAATGRNGSPSLPVLLLNSTRPNNFLSTIGSSQTCPYTPTITCDPSSTYRTIDGSCNNQSSPYIGMSDTPYDRIFPAGYTDFIKEPRVKSFFNYMLPTPRKISLDFFSETADQSVNNSNVFAVFARFVEHDLYKTKLMDANECCNTVQPNISVCMDITLEQTDVYFSTYGRTCLPKAKIVPSPALDCKTDLVIQPINQNTHYLDLSNVYGSTKTVADSLRTKKDGLLKVSDTNNLLPKSNTSKCKLPTLNPNNIHCFEAGDDRVNNDPLLMTMYTIWVREHNYIANELKAIMSNADDETIFQIARKILIAQYQHIVYNEFLPTLNSATTLKPLASGYTTKSDKLKPNIANSFSIAFTALVDTATWKEFTSNNTSEKLEDFWYKPDMLWETDGIQDLVEGMLVNNAGKIDRHVVKSLTNEYLAEGFGKGKGTDAVAVNIQQSRENGLTNYFIINALQTTQYTIKDYAGLTNLDTTQTPDVVAELKKLYLSVYDIEFLPGVFSETAISGAEIGPMMSVIIEDQFKKLKEGDTYYYEHNAIFTSDRLAEIKKITMAKILCRNANLLNAQTNAFQLIDSSNNPDKVCSSIESPDICIWAGVSWSDWIKSPCMGGFRVSTRQCQFLPGSKCQCTGEPFKFENCPTNLVHNLISLKAHMRFLSLYSEHFDPMGHPKQETNESTEEIIKKILKESIQA